MYGNVTGNGNVTSLILYIMYISNAKSRADIQKAHRERVKVRNEELRALALLTLNIPKAVRYAASLGETTAQKLMADSDEQILKNLEAHFVAAAKMRPQRPKKKTTK